MDVASSAGTTAVTAVLWLAVAAAVIAVIVMISRKAAQRWTSGKAGRAAATRSGNVTRLLDQREQEGLIASIGAGLVAEGFTLQGNVPGLYVFEKRKRPSIIITILLLLLWIIPGIIYLLLGGSREVASIRVTELPLNIQVDAREAVRLPVCLSFSVNATAKVRKQISGVLAPYAIDIDKIIEHPEQILVGETLEKKVEVECDFCCRTQDVAVPFRIETVEGNRGFGPGGSLTVICSNPDCRKPFEVTWDNVIIELEFKR